MKKLKSVFSNNLVKEVDETLRSLAVNKFIIETVQDMKENGSSHEQIQSDIGQFKNISVDTDTIFDKKMLGKKSKEVLEKTNGIIYQDPLKIKSNPDTDTIEDVKENNKLIYKYLLEAGEVDIANYIYDLMNKKEEVKSTEDNNTDIKELSLVNSKILEKLSEIEENMIDEQDTSVSIPSKLEKQVIKEDTNNENGDKWFYKMLGKFLGKGLLGVIGAVKSFAEFAGIIAGAGWVFLKTKVGDLFKKLIGKALAPIKSVISKISGTIGGLLKKIPLIEAAITASKNGLNKIKKTSNVPDIDKSPDTKNTSGKALDKKTSNVPDIKTTSGKAPSKSSAGKLAKTAKVLKGIPGIGTAITLGFGLYDGVTGYNEASDNLGIKEEDLTVLNKSSSAAGSVVSGFTLGLVEEKGASKAINNFFGGNNIIKKYENLGIINHNSANWYGTNKESEILDWEKVQNLNANEIKEIIRIDDWKQEDLSKLYTILKSKIGNLDNDDLKNTIKKNEGLRLQPYKDSVGKWTIGYGHLIDKNEQYLMSGITKEQAEMIFDEDFEHHKEAAMKMPGFNKHPKEVQNVLIDMTYNMGPGWWKKWKETPKAIQNGNYKKAADLLSQSAYARQTKGRAERNIEILRTYEKYSESNTGSIEKKAKVDVSKTNKMVKTESSYNKTMNNVKSTKQVPQQNVIKNDSYANINNNNKEPQSAFGMMATS